MLLAAGAAPSRDEARRRLEHALESGAGLEKLREMIAAQGGDARVCDDTGLLPRARYILPVPAMRDGYVCSMDTTGIGYVAQGLGAGRARKTDVIDPAVGLVMAVRIGERLCEGEPIAYIHANDEARGRAAVERMQQLVRLSDAQPQRPPLVLAEVTPQGVRRA